MAKPLRSDPRKAGQAWPGGPGFSGQNNLRYSEEDK